MEATTFEAVPQSARSVGSLQRKIDWRGAFWVASGVPALVLFTIGAIAAASSFIFALVDKDKGITRKRKKAA